MNKLAVALAYFEKLAEGETATNYTSPWVAAPAALAGTFGLLQGGKLLANKLSPALFGSSGGLGFSPEELGHNNRAAERLGRMAVKNNSPVTAYTGSPAAGSAFVASDLGSGISLGAKDGLDAGVLAHELGHATQSLPGSQHRRLARGNNAPGLMPLLSRLAAYSKTRKGALAVGLPGLPGLVAAYGSSDENTALAGTAAMTGAPVLTLVNEIDASRRGAKMLERANMAKPEFHSAPGFASYLKKVRTRPYAGLPTYAAAAGAPMLPYLFRKGMGDFDRK